MLIPQLPILTRLSSAFAALRTNAKDSNDLHLSFDIQVTKKLQVHLERTPQINHHGQSLDYRMTIRTENAEHLVSFAINVPTQPITGLPAHIGQLQYLHNEKQNDLWINRTHQQTDIGIQALRATIEDNTQPQLVRTALGVFEQLVQSLITKINPTYLNKLSKTFETNVRTPKTLTHTLQKTDVLNDTENQQLFVHINNECHTMDGRTHTVIYTAHGNAYYLYHTKTTDNNLVLISDQDLLNIDNKALTTFTNMTDLVEVLLGINPSLLTQDNLQTFYKEKLPTNHYPADNDIEPSPPNEQNTLLGC